MDPIFDIETHTFSCIFTGYVNFSILEKAMQALHRHPQSDSVKYVLLDFTKIISANLSPKKATILAAHDLGFSRSIGKNIRYAFISKDQEVVEFLNKYKELIDRVGRNLSVEIFSDHLEADKWLHFEKN